MGWRLGQGESGAHLLRSDIEWRADGREEPLLEGVGAGVPGKDPVHRPLDGNKLGVQGREGPGCTEHSEPGRVVGTEAKRLGRARQGLTGLHQELGFWFACDQRPLEDFLSKRVRSIKWFYAGE